jgi:diketogulonate reductase-like aldo/keto reductase
VLDALKAGYRHLDCAWMYGVCIFFHYLLDLIKTKLIIRCDHQVDEEVGAAIKESGIPREELFITTKFWPHFGDKENVELCLDLCLQKLGLEYVDLFLSHVSFANFLSCFPICYVSVYLGLCLSDTGFDLVAICCQTHLSRSSHQCQNRSRH